MLAWWQLWESHFRKETCETLINAGLQIPAENAVVGFGKQVRDDQALRRSQVRWIKKHTKGFEMLWGRLGELFAEANRNAFGFDLWDLTEVQFTEYKAENKGHYGWHEDLNWVNRPPNRYHRKLSLVMQLSHPDSYEGGDFEIEQEAPAKAKVRKQGSVVIFPSFLRHRVTPLRKGTRYSLVAWINGPQFR